uniref:Variant surface glycoprotein 1125.2522 n=1 Tax=Trypanosoma brucei TaxID=5691 RepID=A0A1J0R8B4_9TRYP|nr:variant surface glycoprotein 1125.2522 [Trypanosoma brucei]
MTLLSVSHQQKAGSNNDPKQRMSNNKASGAGGFNKACEVANHLKAVAPYLADKMTASTAHINTMMTALQTLAIMMLTQPDKRTDEYKFLYAHVAQELDDAEKTINSNLAKSIKVAAKAALAAGRIDETTSVFWQVNVNAGGNNKYCIAQASGSSAKATATNLEHCVDSADKIKQTIKDDALAKPPTPIATLKEINNAYAPGGPGTGINLCNLAQADSANGGYAKGGNAGPIKWASGLITIGNSDLASSPFVDHSAAAQANTPLAAVYADLDTDVKAYDDVTAKLEQLVKIGGATKPGLTEIKTNAQKLQIGDATTDITLNTAKIDRISEEIRLYNTEHAATLANERKQLFINQLLKIDSAEKQAFALSEQIKITGISQQETVCNKIKDAEKCNTTKQCSFHESGEPSKKCKFNATKATKNGISDTPTGDDRSSSGEREEAKNDDKDGKCTKHGADKPKCEGDKSCKWDEKNAKIPLFL